MRAACRGHVDVCELLIHYGCDVNAKDSLGMTALYMAACAGRTDCCQLLLDSGADANLRDNLGGKTPIHAVASLGNLSVLCTLLDHLDNKDLPVPGFDRDGMTPAHWAALKGHDTPLKLLVNKSPPETPGQGQVSLIHCSVINGNHTAMQVLLDKYRSQEARQFVAQGDRRGQTPLHLAAKSFSRLECLYQMMKLSESLDVRDSRGRTPVMLAARRSNFRALRDLVEAGCGLDAADVDGNTVLHHCCLSPSADDKVVSVMVENILRKVKGLNVSHQNKEGRTPLHLAASAGLVSVTEHLLSRGASVEVSDSKGLTPILACAPTDEVVICMAMMMQVHSTSHNSLLSSASLSSLDLSRRISSSGWKQSLSSCAEERADKVDNDTFVVVNNNSDTAADSDLTWPRDPFEKTVFETLTYAKTLRLEHNQSF